MMNDLRTLVRGILLEKNVSVTFDELENAAKDKYEAALKAVADWQENDKKKSAYIEAAKSAGMNPAGDAARKKFKSDPRYSYDPKISQKKLETLQTELERAKEEYAEFRPDVVGYHKKSRVLSPVDDKSMPPKGKKSFMDISDVKPLTWYSWPKIVSKSGKSYGAAGAKTGEEESGTGPGEEWLAYIFGGQVQGGSVSFDVVTPDGRAWEVKALESPSSNLRPGTEGKKALEAPKSRLDSIMKQLRTFVSVIGKIDLKSYQQDADVIDFIKNFVEEEYSWIVGKGEISQERFVKIRTILRECSKLKNKYGSAQKTPTKTRVALNKKVVDVSRPTFIDIAKKVELETGDASILTGFEELEIALSSLKDPAFTTPSVFLDEWFESVDINEVFSKVDGVFIVNRKGFSMVPKAMFKKAFKFEKISQASPRFSYAFYGSGPTA